MTQAARRWGEGGTKAVSGTRKRHGLEDGGANGCSASVRGARDIGPLAGGSDVDAPRSSQGVHGLERDVSV